MTEQISQNKKRPTVLFQMWEPFRQTVIEENRFYLEQAKGRLLSQFNDIDREADAAGKRWLEDQAPYFDPDRDDPGSVYENAYDHSIEFYQLLSEMRDQTRLSIIAGMFHEWDKKLRSWLVKEIRHWHYGEEALKKIWSANFDEIAELLDATGLAKPNTDYMLKLSTYRYVINVYKHGDGNSFETLKVNHPEFLRKSPIDEILPEFMWMDHTALIATDQQLDELSDTIIEFWKSIPHEINDDTVTWAPQWFVKAQTRDSAKS
ncbi:hypothetical protein CXP47_23620 [Pseudomonas chlororaphis]|uniref:Uncharacterized protein n=1 Tax=Pseudomonas chlororaphis TaxID=587753 RepID=A0AAP9VS62_9PSED|nr:hypothetical protein [Pseudomonas chlororaphis]AUG42741.1 hypothetical protein CXP47_23620 [Pseudomonas chlororaphis]QNR46595.1 hypothetical protein HLB40_23450 [Pseudomonas chlororaphis]